MKRFCYGASMAAEYPALLALVVSVRGIAGGADHRAIVERHLAAARERLASVDGESQFASIKAWRGALRQFGANPTKHRTAAESILRRLRLRDDFAELHPLIMICNALSARYAIPVAVLDTDRIAGGITVAPAMGGEESEAFDGTLSQVPRGEIIFRDAEGHAHSRKWCHKQSRRSAVMSGTANVTIVAEALHEDAARDLGEICDALAADLRACWPDAGMTAVLLRPGDLGVGAELL